MVAAGLALACGASLPALSQAEGNIPIPGTGPAGPPPVGGQGQLQNQPPRDLVEAERLEAEPARPGTFTPGLTPRGPREPVGQGLGANVDRDVGDADLRARGVDLQEGVPLRPRNEELRARGIEPPEPGEGGIVDLRAPFGGGVFIAPGGFVAPTQGMQQQQAQQQQPGVQQQAQQQAPLMLGPQAPPMAGQGVPTADEGAQPTLDVGLPRAQDYTGDEVSGTVLSVNYMEGRADVLSDEGVVTVRGRPSEMALMMPQDNVFLRVSETDTGELWVEPAAPLGVGTADVTQQPGTGAADPTLRSPIYDSVDRIEGRVMGLNADAGIFTIGNRVLYAHPSQLRDLEPGQLVSVSYGTVADRDWAAEIRPTTGTEPPVALPEGPAEPQEGPLGLGAGPLVDVPALADDGRGPLPEEMLEADGLPDPEPSAVPQIVGRGNDVYLLSPDAEAEGEEIVTAEDDLIFEGEG